MGRRRARCECVSERHGKGCDDIKSGCDDDNGYGRYNYDRVNVSCSIFWSSNGISHCVINIVQQRLSHRKEQEGKARANGDGAGSFPTAASVGEG